MPPKIVTYRKPYSKVFYKFGVKICLRHWWKKVIKAQHTVKVEIRRYIEKKIAGDSSPGSLRVKSKNIAIPVISLFNVHHQVKFTSFEK